MRQEVRTDADAIVVDRHGCGCKQPPDGLQTSSAASTPSPSCCHAAPLRSPFRAAELISDHVDSRSALAQAFREVTGEATQDIGRHLLILATSLADVHRQAAFTLNTTGSEAAESLERAAVREVPVPDLAPAIVVPAPGIERIQQAMVMDHIIGKPGINGIQDLKGKRIGFSGVGAVTHFAALSLARKLGWSPDRDMTLVGGSASLDALKQDRVDAIVTSAMVIALAPEAGFKDIGDLTSYKMPLAGSGIMVDKAYLAAHRDTVLRFLKADIEATALMQRDRKVFNAALATWFNITAGRTQDGMFAHVTKFEKKPYPSVDGIKQVFAVYDSAEMKKHTPEEFYDATLMAELDKSGFLDNPK